MDVESLKAWVSVVLAIAVLFVLYFGHRNRTNNGKGIGFRFIQYTVLGISVPIVGILALYEIFPSEVAAGLIGVALGYVASERR